MTMLKKIPQGDFFWIAIALLFPFIATIVAYMIPLFSKTPILLKLSILLPIDLVMPYMITRRLSQRQNNEFLYQITMQRHMIMKNAKKREKVERLKNIFKKMLEEVIFNEVL